MKKKIISLCVVVALLAIMVVGGTLAYFTDTDADVNTMTTGNVKIDQEEWEDPEHEDPWENDEEIIPDVPVDKFVTVENEGSQDAYVRTLIAFEDTWDIGSEVYLGFMCKDELVDEYFVIPTNDVDNWLQFKATVTGADGIVDEAIYTVGVYNYGGQVVASGTTVESLCQVKLQPTATNEWSEYAAGAYNEVGVGTYDVLVLSQATQTGSFDDAADALDTSFGEITMDSDAQVAEWFQAVLQEEWNAKGDGYTVVCEAFNWTTYGPDATVCGMTAPSWMGY